MAEPLTIPEARRGGSSRATVLLLAIASGTAVADLYYVQPLLVTIGNAFHVAGSRTGLFVTLTQIGYACGLLFLVPLGDLFDRRSLILGFFGIGSAGLAFAAISPNASLFAVASVLIGLLSVSAQIIVPYAAHMASDDSRGKTVGTVMSGLLIGILLARTFSGIISHVAGWRTVYIVGAGMLLLLMAVMWRRLPSQPAEKSVGSYPRLLASVLKLVRTQPVLRRRSLYGACVFAAFSVFWTSATFLLSHAPYHYNDAVIGLFGLFGVAGALSASFAGRMADRGHAHIGTGVFLLLALVSFAASAWGGLHLAGVIAGVLLLDLGVQGTHILNQSQIYGLDATARSRLTAAYMTPYFIGGATGSAVSAIVYEAKGWTGVCIVGAAFIAIAMVAWGIESVGRLAQRRAGGA